MTRVDSMTGKTVVFAFGDAVLACPACGMHRFVVTPSAVECKSCRSELAKLDGMTPGLAVKRRTEGVDGPALVRPVDGFRASA